MLKIEHLTKQYKGGKKAVTDLSIHVCPGDIYGFIGQNGAGKTTTIKCVVGIHDFDDGEITVDGLSVKKNSLECKKRMAYIPVYPCGKIPYHVRRRWHIFRITRICMRI